MLVLTGAVPVLAAPVDDGGGTASQPAQRIPGPFTVTPLGCVASMTAAHLDALFAQRLGPLMGWDNPKIIDLGDGRSLWLLSDPYVDPTMTAATLDTAHYLNNTAMIQDGRCFSLLQRMRNGSPVEFAPDLPSGDFFWPLGGTVGAGGLIYVFWSQMNEDAPVAWGDGIPRHPVATWLGVYDPLVWSTVQFSRAANGGVSPQYGSAVQTSGSYTYLFGNSNMLNLDLVGGFWSGPFSGIRMYVARVPAGMVWQAPEYWTGGGWSASAAAAVPYWTRWYVSNAMQPRRIDGHWFSVVKKDEFWGSTLVVDTSSAPAGGWTTLSTMPAVPRLPAERAATLMTTYQPVLLPQRGDDGRLIAILSQNAATWTDAIADPRLYRPQAIAVRG
jgi:hypothetical protein